MRKRHKKKLRSCAMCKPHKMNGANRWTRKDEAGIKEYERAQKGEIDG